MPSVPLGISGASILIALHSRQTERLTLSVGLGVSVAVSIAIQITNQPKQEGREGGTPLRN